MKKSCSWCDEPAAKSLTVGIVTHYACHAHATYFDGYKWDSVPDDRREHEAALRAIVEAGRMYDDDRAQYMVQIALDALDLTMQEYLSDRKARLPL